MQGGVHLEQSERVCMVCITNAVEADWGWTVRLATNARLDKTVRLTTKRAAGDTTKGYLTRMSYVTQSLLPNPVGLNCVYVSLMGYITPPRVWEPNRAVLQNGVI
jgi:hypothetical protein